MTIDTQKLRNLVSFDFELPVSVRDAVDSACDHIDAQAAEIARLRNALELFLTHSPEPECAIWRHVHAVARAALQGKTDDR